MGVQFYNNQVLFDGGAVAFHADCCCEEEEYGCPGYPDNCYTLCGNSYIATITGFTGGQCSYLNGVYSLPSTVELCSFYGGYPTGVYLHCRYTGIPGLFQWGIEIKNTQVGWGVEAGEWWQAYGECPDGTINVHGILTCGGQIGTVVIA